MRHSLWSRTRLALASAALVMAGTPAAHAVSLSLDSQSGDTWTYTLTYDPLDNYAIPGQANEATVRLTGLAGVVSATGPTSTSYDNAYGNAINLAWTPEVLTGGTEVVWTHVGPGTGNYDIPLYVFGFSITAPGQSSGLIRYETSGFSTDVDRGLIDRDVLGTVVGPVPEPSTWALTIAGLALVGVAARRRRG